MNKDTFNRLIKLNRDFYDSVGVDFSKTRQAPWPGWLKVFTTIEPLIRGAGQIKFLDLGAGNGRFLKFLQKTPLKFNYLGVDFSNTMLQKGERAHNIEFRKFDFVNNISSMNLLGTHNVVTAFGVAHHIPNKNFRKDWFGKISSLVKPGGYFVCTFWKFDTAKQKNDVDVELEEGDYILGWGESDARRYCHMYSQQELDEIFDHVKRLGLQKIKSFEDDGKDKKSNEYHIFRKI